MLDPSDPRFIVGAHSVRMFNPLGFTTMVTMRPVYAQGMTVAAQCAHALDRCLRDGHADLPARYYAKAARVVETSWMLATSEDSRFPAVEGVRRSAPMRWMQGYVERVVATSLTYLERSHSVASSAGRSEQAEDAAPVGRNLRGRRQ